MSLIALTVKAPFNIPCLLYNHVLLYRQSLRCCACDSPRPLAIHGAAAVGPKCFRLRSVARAAQHGLALSLACSSKLATTHRRIM